MALHSQCDSDSIELPRLDGTSTGSSVNVVSTQVFWKPKFVARDSAIGRRRAATRAFLSSGILGPGLDRSSSSPGAQVGAGLANFTLTVLSPSTLRAKFRKRR